MVSHGFMFFTKLASWKCESKVPLSQGVTILLLNQKTRQKKINSLAGDGSYLFIWIQRPEGKVQLSAQKDSYITMIVSVEGGESAAVPWGLVTKLLHSFRQTSSVSVSTDPEYTEGHSNTWHSHSSAVHHQESLMLSVKPPFPQDSTCMQSIMDYRYR